MSYDIKENKDKIEHILVRRQYVNNMYSINNLYNIKENKFKSSNNLNLDKYIPENKQMHVVDIPNIGLTVACNALFSNQGLIPFEIEENNSGNLYILVYNYNLKMRRYRLVDYLKTINMLSEANVLRIWSIVNTLYINKEKIKNLLENDNKQIARSIARLSMIGESIVVQEFKCVSIKNGAKYIKIPEGVIGIDLQDKDISIKIEELELPKTLLSIRNRFNSMVVVRCEKLTVYGDYIDYNILDRLEIGKLNVIGKASPDLVCWAYKNTNKGITVEKEYETNQIVGIKKVCECEYKEDEYSARKQLRQLSEIRALGAMVADGERLGVKDEKFNEFRKFLKKL